MTRGCDETHHTPVGIAQRKTDTVQRAMEILKDRELPKGPSKDETRRLFRSQHSSKPDHGR
jgi:hypothetical protein